MELSLNSDVFLSLKNDFDEVLKKVLINMQEQENDTAEINVKVKINLVKIPVEMIYEEEREIVKPMFTHKVTSVLQVKDEKTGSFGGQYELTWDDETEKYILTELNTGQTSLFDSDSKKMWFD